MSRGRVNRVGEIHKTNKHGYVEIIAQESSVSMTVKFLDDEVLLFNIRYGEIKRGRVRHPHNKEFFGIGYLGVGKFNTVDNRISYNRWCNMLQRSYDKKYHEKYPTYKIVTVCDEWHNFQNFAQWVENNYNSTTMKGWSLDKDLLSESNKVYSSETCCFLPQRLNTLLIYIHNKPLVTNIKGRYYAKIKKGMKPFWLGVTDTEEESVLKYINEKRKYSCELLETYKTLLPEKVINKIEELIDMI